MPNSGEKTVFHFSEEQVQALAEMILLAEHPNAAIFDLIGFGDPFAYESIRNEAREKAQEMAANLADPENPGYERSLDEFKEHMNQYEHRMLYMDVDREFRNLLGSGYAHPDNREIFSKASERFGELFTGHESVYINHYVGNSDQNGWNTRSNEMGDFLRVLTGGNVPFLVQRCTQLAYDRALLHVYDDYAGRHRISPRGMLDLLADEGTRAGLNVKGRATDTNICALAYAKYKNPELSLEELINDPVAVPKTGEAFLNFLRRNPIESTTEEIRQNSLKNLADFYRGWDNMVKEIKIPDFSDPQEVIRNAKTNSIYLQMDEGVSGTRKHLERIPEFVEAYGGKQALEQASDGSLLLNEVNVVQKRMACEDDLQARVVGRYLLNLAGKGLAGKTWEEAGRKLKNGVFTDAMIRLTDPDNRELAEVFGKVSENDVNAYLNGGPLPIDEKLLREGAAKVSNGIGVLNSRDYLEIYPAEEERDQKGANADRRMEMFRSRGKLAPGKKDTQEKAQKRAFGAEQFQKYMKQIDSALYPEANGEGTPLMRDAAYAVMGIQEPEDLIFIDGKPAKAFVKELGYKEEELAAHPDILRAEIAAAMTGGRSHVDLMVPDKDEKGVTVMKARELRTDLRDLNGKEHLLESTREKRAQGLYQDKKRGERLTKLGSMMTEKRNRAIDDDMKKKALTEMLLVGEGARFADLAMEGSFANARKQCREQAEAIYAEAMAGKPERLKQAMEDYKKAAVASHEAGEFSELSKEAYAYMKKTTDGAEILRAAFGQEMPKNEEYRSFKKCVDAGSSAVTMQGALNIKTDLVTIVDSVETENRSSIAKKAGVGTLDRGGSFLSNVTAWIRMKEPNGNLTDIWKDPERIGREAQEYMNFLKENPAVDENIPADKRREFLQKQAEYYKNYREQVLSETFFDISDPEQRREHALESQIRRDLSIDCNQSEEGGLQKSSEYIKVYGGEEKLTRDSNAVENVQAVHKLLDLIDDVTKNPVSRATAKYMIDKYAPVLKGMNAKDLAIFSPQNNLSREYMGLFQTMIMSADTNMEEICARYVNGGACPFVKEKADKALTDYFKEANVVYHPLEEMVENYKAAKREQNQKKMSFNEVVKESNEKDGKKKKETMPERKRSAGMKLPNVPKKAENGKDNGKEKS